MKPQEIDNADPNDRVSDLCSTLESYLSPKDVHRVYQAFVMGEKAHRGQTRLTGEPYITHPLAVARILSELKLDADSIIAAILHDVIEDTSTSKNQIADAFGDEVAELVDGVSKLTQMKFDSKEEQQAANFRKMVLAMAEDIRVILIKLADRLHNMRTLGIMPPQKKRRIARETMEIYAPIANRLGMYSMRVELEDLCFEAKHPMRFRVLKQKLRRDWQVRKDIIAEIENNIHQHLAEMGIEARVLGRRKHIASIYRKMEKKKLHLHDVMDVFGGRIVVKDVDTCYRVLGAMHNFYKPVPDRFKDYIAIPKANGYQSLHTALFAHGVNLEIQIRTEEMHRVAESGIAAHWLYKTDPSSNQKAQKDRARDWVKSLLEMQQTAGNPMEFIEHVKLDLFPDEVYVFTPKGDIQELPQGATVLDFAYAVHSDVGNSAIGAKINNRIAPLSSPLKNGQTVAVLTAPGAKPSPTWLNFVVTAKARTAIRHSLKNLRSEDAVGLGERLLNSALSHFKLTLEDIPQEQIDKIIGERECGTITQMLEDIGLGKRIPLMVARALANRELASGTTDERNKTPLAIKGSEGTVVSFGRCCHPLPGDAIVGFVSAGKGLVIHRNTCANFADHRKHPEKWIDVEWQDGINRDFHVIIKLEVENQRGALATLASALSEAMANIENVVIDEKDGMLATVTFTVGVTSRKHLADAIKRLRALKLVKKIIRS